MAEQSRNTWINKDEPSVVSSMAPYKDGYEDILENRRNGSDVKYSLKARLNVPVYKYQKHRTAEDLKTHVLKSDRVQYTIEQMAYEMKIPQAKLQKEAQEIMDEMAHSFSIKAVRSFAYLLIKVFKSLFSRIYVNEEGIQRLRHLIHEYPVLLMPTHRSYMDFLLVSYIFYDCDLPLPVIAAAMDFSNMKFFGWLLRKCGAFYIRRSFGTDRLYWAVFTEYVQTQLRNGDSPVEFFVEGTRSRTNKSYVPRIGMLSAALEAYFKAEVPDIMIVPISISYDRILEESLYAYELLGIPKPKESASGVFKARSILDEDFGCVHFHIGEALSIRQFSDNHVDRVKHALEPRYVNNLTKEEELVSRQLAYTIILEHHKHLVVSPWSLMASVLMQSANGGISVRELVKETEWLKRQAYNLGAYVDWPGNTSPEAVVRFYLGQHTNIVTLNDDDYIELKIVQPSHIKGKVADQLMLNAATDLILASYRNQLLHVFVRVAMVAISIYSSTKDTIAMDELLEKYKFLEKLFSRDFIFLPGNTKKDFDEAVLSLLHSGGISVLGSEVQVKKSLSKHTTFFSQMFEPFLYTYWVLCQHLLSLSGDVHHRPLAKKTKQLAKEAQRLGLQLVQESVIKHYEVLSLDTLTNGLGVLVDMSAMYKDKRADETWLSPNNVTISQICNELSTFIEIPSVEMSSFTGSKQRPVVVQAKI